MSELLKIEHLSVDYITDFSHVNALTDLNLTIHKGEVVGLVGETGAGKTTTAKAILRILQAPPAKIISGAIYFNGENLQEKSERKMRSIRGSEISMIFQDPMSALNPVVKVIDQVAEVYRIHGVKSQHESFTRAKEILSRVGIRNDRIEEYPHQFSGGMKQRVVIAMALAANPKLLLADEPTTALDVTIQAQILNLISGLREEYDTSMLLISHDLGVIAQTCDRVAVIYAGMIVVSGSKKQIFSKPMHPYTIGLFECIPDISKEDKKLVPIKGLVPDPSDLPPGCPFCPRCPKASPTCQTCSPNSIGRGVPSVEVESGHFVACIHLNEVEMVRNER